MNTSALLSIVPACKEPHDSPWISTFFTYMSPCNIHQCTPPCCFTTIQMREHVDRGAHKHERQQRAVTANSNNSAAAVGRLQQQHSPAMSQQHLGHHSGHPNHPTQLPLQSRNSVNSHTTGGSTSSSLTQSSPQERQVSLNELRNELEVGKLVTAATTALYCTLLLLLLFI